MDVAFERALPGGAIDLSLSNKADKACALPSGTDLNNVTDPNEYACEFDDLYLNFPVVTNAYSFSVHKTTSYALYQVFRPFHIDAIYFRRKYYDGWHDWIQIATATPPTDYDLPLASGITATEGGCFYSKTQDGIVNLVVSCKKETDGLVSGSIIATLPVDVRPAREAVTNAFAITSDNTTYGCSIRIWPSGEIKIWVPVTNINQVGFQISFVAGN